MKIDSYAVASSSERLFVSQYQRMEKMQVNGGALARPSNGGAKKEAKQEEDTAEITKNAILAARQAREENIVVTTKSCGKAPGMMDFRRSIENSLWESFIYCLTGKKTKLESIDETFSKINMGETNDLEVAAARMEAEGDKAQAPAKGPAANARVSYVREESYFEYESVSFSSRGIVKTADGKEINFDVSFNMTRSFYESHQTAVDIAAKNFNVKDPLVINFGGNAPGLSDMKFSFDIDNDGKEDQISCLTQGNGFLALDKNGDGQINNGSELFGPKSGNGFSELRAYDGDKNGWIDENDAIFNKLRVWTKDEDGKDKLFALGELGIGALYLGDINTNFSMAGNGAMRSSSVFLREDGTAGTMHHIDLAV